MRLDVLAAGVAFALVLSQLDLAIPRAARAQTPPQYQYLSPSPGARLVSRWNNIVIRQGGALDRSTLDPRLLSVTGAQSGVHAGRLTISDDARSLVLVPDKPFALGETVSVRLEQGMKAMGGEVLPAVSFGFTVSGADPRAQPSPAPEGILRGPRVASASPASPPITAAIRMLATQPCDTLPTGFPPTRVFSTSYPDPREIFLAPFYLSSFFETDGIGHLLILGDAGLPVFYRALPGLGPTYDFKRQPNGLLTYFLTAGDKFYALDSTYAVVDSFATGNGYFSDFHDIQLLPDGHALLMAYDLEPVDMSAIVPGGDPNAQVVGLIVQELDTAKDVVFQWRSWDHFAITDCSTPQVPLTASVIDYVHGNAIELDSDGNLLLSSRHLDEITKINRQTGDVMWRMGPRAVRNQFTFVNDPRGFGFQHDIRRLPNGNITLFDNGNWFDPLYSRAVEYALDEVGKNATEVWEFRSTPDIYGGFMGNVQRHANGGTTISWGGTFPNPKITGVNADGSPALEVAFEDSTHYLTYRAFRFPWRTTRFVTDADSLEFGALGTGGTATLPLAVRNTTAGPVTITCAVSTDPAFTVSTQLPRTLEPGLGATFEVSFAPTDETLHLATLYLREVSETDLVAQSVTLRGTGLGVLAVAGQATPQFRLRANRPNPFDRATTIEFAVARMDRVRLEILDVRGRLIETLVDGVRPAGRYEVTWAPKHAPSGIYFCRLDAGGRIESRKLALMK